MRKELIDQNKPSLFEERYLDSREKSYHLNGSCNRNLIQRRTCVPREFSKFVERFPIKKICPTPIERLCVPGERGDRSWLYFLDGVDASLRLASREDLVNRMESDSSAEKVDREAG